ncbi:protein of unknown function [Methylocaldum szegediense]|uniref:Uncharacterized protein n=1 Tax=Methylocaldum szegediense TaxID=73780 RepID=A0ABM9I1K3_9GAMM|nr:protein of unknown function [Methylocaldum szegediense]
MFGIRLASGLGVYKDEVMDIRLIDIQIFASQSADL